MLPFHPTDALLLARQRAGETYARDRNAAHHAPQGAEAEARQAPTFAPFALAWLRLRPGRRAANAAR